MKLHEYAGNAHIHTPFSDGELYHAEVAQAAVRAGLDFIITTDHNVRVGGIEGYYGDEPDGRVLLLVGEEIHDTRRKPQANHLLVYGLEDELASLATEPQQLIDSARDAGGFSFIAHPFEYPIAIADEPDLSWVDWDVSGYTGIELWNFMSEFKGLLTSWPKALRYTASPEKGISGPSPQTLEHWDRLLAKGERIRIIGGADAHGTTYSKGPLKRVLFPYEFLFRCVNTHILSRHPFEGVLEHDKRMVEGALRAGHAFVGYDLPAPTKGFRFSAQGLNQQVIMGDWLRLNHGVTLQIVVPQTTDTRLIFNGEVVARETEGTHMTYIATKPGAYRVEVYIDFEGKQRGWIFSNPIFIVE